MVTWGAGAFDGDSCAVQGQSNQVQRINPLQRLLQLSLARARNDLGSPGHLLFGTIALLCEWN